MMLKIWLLATVGVAAMVYADDVAAAEHMGEMDGEEMHDGMPPGADEFEEEGRPSSREDAVKEFTQIIKQYDTDGDGQISKAEMRVWMMNDHPDAEAPPADEEIDTALDELMREADANGNGGIELEEMLKMSGFGDEDEQ